MITSSKEQDKSPEELDSKEKVSHDDIYESDEKAPDDKDNLVISSNENYKSPEELDDKEKASRDEISEPDEYLMSLIENSTPKKKPSSNSPPTKKNTTKAKSPNKRKTEVQKLKGPNAEEENLGPRRKKRKPARETGE